MQGGPLGGERTVFNKKTDTEAICHQKCRVSGGQGHGAGDHVCSWAGHLSI